MDGDLRKAEIAMRRSVDVDGTVELTEAELDDGRSLDAEIGLPPLPDMEEFDEDEVRKDIKEAVKADRKERKARNPKVDPTFIKNRFGQAVANYYHPPQFTTKEDCEIAEGLIARIPLYVIASRIHCGRSTLSRHIKQSKFLSRVWEDAHESRLDHAEYQIDRAIEAGNVPAIMWYLERKGKDRGYGQQVDAGNEEETSRIMIGEISDSEVESAEKKIAELEAAAGLKRDADGNLVSVGELDGPSAGGDGTVAIPNGDGKSRVGPLSPMEMAVAEQKMDEEKAEKERKRLEKPVSIPKDDVKVGPSPWDDGGSQGFGGGGGGGQSFYPFDGGGAPWDDGGGFGGF